MDIRAAETAVERCRASALSFGAKDHANALRDALSCIQEFRYFASMSKGPIGSVTADLESRLLEFARTL